MRDLPSNDRAELQGLPLSLMITALVMALVIPSVWMYSDMYIEKQVENDLLNEMKKIDNAVDVVSSGGEETRMVLELNFDSHPFARIEYIKLKNSYSNSLFYKIGGEPENYYSFGNVHLMNSTEQDLDLQLPTTECRIVIFRCDRDKATVEIGVI